MFKLRDVRAFVRVERIRNRSVALSLCYAVGLLADQIIGVGAAGYPLLLIAAPAAVGMLVRMGDRLDPIDLLKLFAVHIVMGLLFRFPLEATLWAGARDLATIAVGVLAFQLMRRRGAVASPVGLMAALVVVALASSLAAVAVEAAAMLGGGALDWVRLAALMMVGVVSMTLMLSISITQGRDRSKSFLDSQVTNEREPRAWEYVGAAAVAMVMVEFSIVTGWPVAALAASVALLWFALRLGLFATTVAAYGFAVIFLMHGAAAPWLEPFSPASTAAGDILRYIALTLLATPSIVVATVVFEQQRLKRMFAYRARHDALTRLTNRAHFLEMLDAYAEAARRRERRFLLLLVDLDHFKAVNDTFGHARGDKMLIAVSSRIRASFRATDVVARLGGDEFAVIAPISSVEDAMRLAKRVVDNVYQDCDLEGVSLRPSVTVGGALAPDNAAGSERLLLLADEALYKAKAAGRNCWRFAGDELRRPAIIPPPAALAAHAEHEFETVFID